MFEHVIRRYNKKELTNSPCKFKSKNISKENVFRKMNLVVENLDELKKKIEGLFMLEERTEAQ